MTDIRLHKALEDYIVYWESLTARSVRLIEKYALPSVRFMDPLAQMQGIDDVENFIRRIMNEKTSFKIRITDHSWGQDNKTAYLRWVLTYIASGKKSQRTIRGMSEVMFANNGQVMSHINHWDSATYILNHLPVAGWLNRKIIDKILS